MIRALLVRLSWRKFDDETARQVAQRLRGVRDSAALAEALSLPQNGTPPTPKEQPASRRAVSIASRKVGNWVIDCAICSELIDRLSMAGVSEDLSRF